MYVGGRRASVGQIPQTRREESVALQSVGSDKASRLRESASELILVAGEI